MTRYRKTMAEAWNDSILIESGLMGTIKPDQLDNIKKVWAKKTMKDVTPGVKAMLAKLDMPTKVAVKHANINVLSKLVLDEKDPDEGVELDEGRMKDIFTADQEGKSAEEIAKRLKISVSTVKSILGIKEELDEAVGHFQKLMLTYGKPGGQAMVYYTDYMQDLQNRAQEYRKKGYIIGKMGRSVPMNQLPSKMPMKGKDIKEALEELDESTAAREIARTNTKKDSMDYAMYNKSIDLLKSKKYDELKKFLKKSDTAPREYVMSTIAKKEPATFKKMYGDQTGYYSLMNQKEDYNAISQIDEVANFTATMLATLKKEYEPMKGKSISAARARQLMNILDKVNDANLEILAKHKIPFVSGGAAAKLRVRKMSKKGVKISTMAYGGSGFYKEEGAQDIAGVDNDNRAPIEELFGISSNANHRSKTIKMLDTMNIKHEKSGLNGLVIKGVDKDKQQNLLDKIKKDVGPFTTSTKEELEEKYTVQITKKDGGKVVHGSYKTKPEAEKFIKWYKTGDMKGTKDVKVIPEGMPGGANSSSRKGSVWRKAKKWRFGMKVGSYDPKGKELEEMSKDKAYAIGMAAAKKHTGDTEPPLEKSTITKGHEIADKLLKKEKRIRPTRLGESAPKGQKMYGEGAKKLVDRIIKEKMEKKQ